MEVKNCRECTRLFNYIGGARLCPECKVKFEEKFAEVKRFVEDNRNVSVQRVSEEMDVSVAQINQWVREERLIFAEGSVAMIYCDGCGTAIRTGRFCDACKRTMVNSFSSMYQKPTQKMPAKSSKGDEKDRMRFLK
jgi:uncharacterized protein (UPF0212 family)